MCISLGFQFMVNLSSFYILWRSSFIKNYLNISIAFICHQPNCLQKKTCPGSTLWSEINTIKHWILIKFLIFSLLLWTNTIHIFAAYRYVERNCKFKLFWSPERRWATCMNSFSQILRNCFGLTFSTAISSAWNPTPHVFSVYAVELVSTAIQL